MLFKHISFITPEGGATFQRLQTREAVPVIQAVLDQIRDGSRQDCAALVETHLHDQSIRVGLQDVEMAVLHAQESRLQTQIAIATAQSRLAVIRQIETDAQLNHLQHLAARLKTLQDAEGEAFEQEVRENLGLLTMPGLRHLLRVRLEAEAEQLRCYVAGRGVALQTSGTTPVKPADTTLLAHVWAFLDHPHLKACLLTGPGGSGKSLFAASLEAVLWQEWKSSEDWIPLRIPLRQIDNGMKLMDEYLNTFLHNLKDAERRAILGALHNKKIVVFLDGYDELPRTRANRDINFYVSAKLKEHLGDKVKLIISCRDTYIESRRDMTDPIGQLFAPPQAPHHMTHVMVQPFQLQDKEQLIANYVATQDSVFKGNYSACIRFFQLYPGIYDNIHSPFLLQTLLGIFDRMASTLLTETPAVLQPSVEELRLLIEQHLPTSLNESRILEQFMNNWVAREYLNRFRLSADADHYSEKHFRVFCWNYAITLAREMTALGLTTIHFKTTTSDFQSRFLNMTDPFQRIGFWSAPLKLEGVSTEEKSRFKEGDFGFLHPSLMEFLARRPLLSTDNLTWHRVTSFQSRLKARHHILTGIDRTPHQQTQSHRSIRHILLVPGDHPSENQWITLSSNGRLAQTKGDMERRNTGLVCTLLAKTPSGFPIFRPFQDEHVVYLGGQGQNLYVYNSRKKQLEKQAYSRLPKNNSPIMLLFPALDRSDLLCAVSTSGQLCLLDVNSNTCQVHLDEELFVEKTVAASVYKQGSTWRVAVAGLANSQTHPFSKSDLKAVTTDAAQQTATLDWLKEEGVLNVLGILVNWAKLCAADNCPVDKDKLIQCIKEACCRHAIALYQITGKAFTRLKLVECHQGPIATLLATEVGKQQVLLSGGLDGVLYIHNPQALEAGKARSSTAISINTPIYHAEVMGQNMLMVGTQTEVVLVDLETKKIVNRQPVDAIATSFTRIADEVVLVGFNDGTFQSWRMECA